MVSSQLPRDEQPFTSGVQKLRAVFHGRTNAQGSDGARAIARHYSLCMGALDGRAAITRAFYDISTCLASSSRLTKEVCARSVRRVDANVARSTSRRGLSDWNRAFEVVSAPNSARVSRRRRELAERGCLAAENRMRIHYPGTGALPQHPALAATDRVTPLVEWFRDIRARSALQDWSERERRAHCGG